MSESGFFERKRISPTALTIVIALHGAAITALALSKMEVIREHIGRTEIWDVPLTPDPPPEPVDKPEPKETPRADTHVTLPKPPIAPPVRDPVVFDQGPVLMPPRLDELPGKPVVSDPPAPPVMAVPDPVRVAARIDPRSQLQPPYPASEERAEVEGKVVVRLVIGPDGRVKRVEKVSATNQAFYSATERHALRAWRFKPATVDGKPIESSTTMTVHFKLDA